jgi:hypothetical protein
MEKESDLCVQEACSVYKMCFEYLLKWIVSFNEFDCFRWLNLNYALSFSDIQSTIKYLRETDVIVDDVKCSDGFCNLKTFVQSVQRM